MMARHLDVTIEIMLQWLGFGVVMKEQGRNKVGAGLEHDGAAGAKRVAPGHRLGV